MILENSIYPIKNQQQTSCQQMSKQGSNQPFRKKYGYEVYREPHVHEKVNTYQTPSKYNTIQSKHTDIDILNAKFSTQSSRIADETEQITSKNANYENVLRQKVEYFESQTYKLIEKKDKEIYFLTVELQNYDLRFRESQEINNCQQEEIQRLRNQIQKLLSENHQFSQQYQYFQEKISKISLQNSKLKQSIQILIQQKNEYWRNDNKKEYMSAQNSHTVHFLKREVEDLKIMIAELEYSLKNCSSCFSLQRENQELTEAYDNLQKIYNELNYNKAKHEQDLLQNITVKIQENQNIIRQNLQLRDKRTNSSSMKMGRQKFKESVAKRCRTLTDQF